MPSTSGNVAAGDAGTVTAQHPAYRQLDAIIGRWMTTGHAYDADGSAGAPITASDIYEWAPGGCFILHTAYGTIGELDVGGIEMIGYDNETGKFRTWFFDSQGNVTAEELAVDGAAWTWSGTTVRCTGTLEDAGRRLVCRHERREDEMWVASMDVTLMRVR